MTIERFDGSTPPRGFVDDEAARKAEEAEIRKADEKFITGLSSGDADEAYRLVARQIAVKKGLPLEESDDGHPFDYLSF